MGLQARRIVKGLDVVRRELARPAGNRPVDLDQAHATSSWMGMRFAGSSPRPVEPTHGYIHPTRGEATMSTRTRDPSAIDRWTKDAQYLEYSKAANPIGHQTSRVPYADFPSRLHEEGPTRVVPFDLSDQLRCRGPATSPAPCANYIRILSGECLQTQPNATSEDGNIINAKRAEWKAGSAFVTPPGYWHAHYNESGRGHLIPIQDAGLHTYLRSLDIKFFHPNHRSFISLKA